MSLDSGPDSLQSQAASYISQDRFHQRFELPATAEHAALNFSFADVGASPSGAEGSPQPPVILFIPGMFASRYISIPMHRIAEKSGVRLLLVDR